MRTKLLFINVIALISLLHVSCSRINYSGEVLLVGPGDYAFMRYNIHTGETWQVLERKWVKVIEPSPIPRSTYSILNASEGKDGTMMTLRFDLQSGKAWIQQGLKWVEILEDEIPE